jgi:hypothetical protein
VNQKGAVKRGKRLSVRVTPALKKAVEERAARERKTIADTVILLLEEVLRLPDSARQ